MNPANPRKGAIFPKTLVNLLNFDTDLDFADFAPVNLFVSVLRLTAFPALLRPSSSPGVLRSLAIRLNSPKQTENRSYNINCIVRRRIGEVEIIG